MLHQSDEWFVGAGFGQVDTIMPGENTIHRFPDIGLEVHGVNKLHIGKVAGYLPNRHTNIFETLPTAKRRSQYCQSDEHAVARCVLSAKYLERVWSGKILIRQLPDEAAVHFFWKLSKFIARA